MGLIEKFEVDFDNSPTAYNEGDYVTGHVELVTTDDLKYKAIYIELRGIAVVFWTRLYFADKELTGPALNEPKGDVSKVQYSDKVVFHEKGGSFLGKGPVLPAGEHRFTFSIKLPSELPSSFEGEYGQIRYTARGVVERPAFKPNVVCMRTFTVLSGLDLGFISEAMDKIEICKYKELGRCCMEGSVTIDWVIDRSGFVAGEDIWISGSVQNDSKQAVVGSSVALFMVVAYKSGRRWRKERRKLVEVEKPATPVDEVTLWNDALSIPPLPPTGLGRCKVIDITYELEFRATLDGPHAPIVHIKEIYIGTVLAGGDMLRSYATMSRPYASQLSGGDDPELLVGSPASLTRILAVAAGDASGAPDPSAPSLATLERGESVGGVSTGRGSVCEGEECKGGLSPGVVFEERPPPFAPMHGGWFEMEESACAPTAPSSASLLRLWSVEGRAAMDPAYSEAEFELDPGALIDGLDSADISFQPVYIFYPTLGRTRSTNGAP